MISHPSPMLAEVDLDIGRVVVIIVVLLVGFIQWVIKVLKEKAESAERARRVPTQEELEARRRAWEQQTRPVPSEPPAPEPSSGGTFKELLGEFRKAMEEAQRPAAPPPLPPPSTPPRSMPSHTPVAAKAAPPEKPRLPAPVVPPSSPAAVLHRPITTRRPHPLTTLLHTPEGYRQAFVLREVLGPPRALHDYRGPED